MIVFEPCYVVHLLLTWSQLLKEIKKIIVGSWLNQSNVYFVESVECYFRGYQGFEQVKLK